LVFQVSKQKIKELAVPVFQKSEEKKKDINTIVSKQQSHIKKQEQEERIVKIQEEPLEQAIAIEPVENVVIEKALVNEMQTEKKVLEPFEASFTCEKKSCEGQLVSFIATSTCATCTYVWYFGDETQLEGRVVKHAYIKEGNYEVRLQVNQYGKSIATSQQIQINPLPEKAFEVDFDYEQSIPTYRFSYLGEQPKAIAWHFPDGELQNGIEIKKAFLQKGEQNIQIDVVNEYGCRLAIKQSLEVERVLDLMAPTAFSPNNDGDNDTWMPKMLQEQTLFDDFTLQIFDKSKRLVFTSTHPKAQWDGTLQGLNRKAFKNEAFVWQANVRNVKTGKYQQFQGSIVVLD